MARKSTWILLAGAAGLGAGWLLGRRERLPSPPPTPPAEGPAPAAELPKPLAPPPHARGEPAEVTEDRPTTLAPVDCDLGLASAGSLRISWRSVVLGDPRVSPGELADRIRDRARTLSPGPEGQQLTLPTQADVLLVMDGDRVLRSFPLAWDEHGATCIGTDTLYPTVQVSGRVLGLEPGDRVEVFLCGDWVQVDARGRFAGKAPAVDPCLAFATRRDGMLPAMGALVDLDLSAGGALDDLELDLPDYEMAGIGAALQVTDGGVEVLQAIPGGPAQEAGLQAGDLVVVVDGEEIGGWELADVVASITGPAGTEVELLVEGEDGQEHRLVIERQPIPED